MNAGAGCYWERKRAFTGTFDDIIDNEFVSGGGQQLVTILASDVGFENDGDCGTWTRISDEPLPQTYRPLKTRDDVELTWRAHYQHRTGMEPRSLVRK